MRLPHIAALCSWHPNVAGAFVESMMKVVKLIDQDKQYEVDKKKYSFSKMGISAAGPHLSEGSASPRWRQFIKF